MLATHGGLDNDAVVLFNLGFFLAEEVLQGGSSGTGEVAQR